MNRFASSLHWSFWSSKKTIICHYYVEAVEQVCIGSELDQNLFVFLVKRERDILTLPEVVLNLQSNKNFNSRLNFHLEKYKTGISQSFGPKSLNLIQYQTVGRKRRASGPALCSDRYSETSPNDQKR